MASTSAQSEPRKFLNLPQWKYLLKQQRIAECLQKDYINPFWLNPSHMLEQYHVDLLLVERLISQTEKYIENVQIPASIRMFAALYYFANGTFQPEFKRIFYKKEMENLIHVSKAIGKVFHLHVKFPPIGGFETDSRYPSLGVVDRYQIRIKVPVLQKREKYLNSEGFHSISLQLISHLSLKILQAECTYGSTTLGKHYDEDEPEQSEPFVLTDPRYKLHPSVILPFMQELKPGEAELKNYQALAGEYSRRMIETFRRNFPCLRLLKMSPENAQIVIRACIVLHNLMFDRDLLRHLNESVKPIQGRQFATQPSKTKKKAGSTKAKPGTKKAKPAPKKAKPAPKRAKPAPKKAMPAPKKAKPASKKTKKT